MSILFSEIYSKSIGLFDDPKITKAYETNKIQFDKLMYSYLQNAIGLFNNPASIGMRLANYKAPSGQMETFDSDGVTPTYKLDDEFILEDSSKCLYQFMADGSIVNGAIDTENRTITFDIQLETGKQYAFEQYFIGEFLEDFKRVNYRNSNNDDYIVGLVKDILARMLVRSWAEEERNFVLDIRNLMQDSDFKISGNASVLKAKNSWIDQLDNEILQMQNKLGWNIRFLSSSRHIGRG